jgi:hypothetical protein
MEQNKRTKKNEKIANMANKNYIHSVPGFLTCGASPDAPQCPTHGAPNNAP